MTTLTALAAFLAHDLTHGLHTVVRDWLDEAELTYDARTGRAVGLAIPVRCLDCSWNTVAHLTVITLSTVDVAVADMNDLHNRTRPEGKNR
ncbi:MAG: hypothetical protein ACRDQD_01120 [Nocardioidaceae bacterium]